LRGESGKPLRALRGECGDLCVEPDLRPADPDLQAGPTRGGAGQRTRRVHPARHPQRRQHPGGGVTTAQKLANAATGGTDGSGLLGSLSTSTINQIIVNSEANALAAFCGTSLSYWSRINLYAAGYFQGVTGSLNLASGDTVKTDVTIDPTGALGGTGTIAGNVTNAGGTIKPGDAPGVMTILGNLDETLPSDLAIELGGTNPGTDQLIVDGSASL
jgi:subtilase-type serine protease